MMVGMVEEPTYTIKDIARLILGSDEHEEFNTTWRQIQHWVMRGALTPVGRRHPGRGRERRFDANGVRQAFIIRELMGYGFSMDNLFIANEMFHAFQNDEPWQTAVKGKPDVFLIVMWDAATDETAWDVTVGKPNLELLTMRHKRKPASPSEMPQQFNSAIVVALTPLFSAIGI